MINLHQRIRMFAALFSLLLLAGCKADISTREPFAEYVNRPVTLTRSAYLSPRDALLYGNEKLLHAGPVPAGPQDELLVAGTPVRIRSVTAYTSGIPMIAAHGSVSKSLGAPPVEFEFIWAPTGDGEKFELIRAPWEAATAPERREFHVTPR